jgi:ABC-type branched-subunit amino acid transport system permease subunit
MKKVESAMSSIMILILLSIFYGFILLLLRVENFWVFLISVVSSLLLIIILNKFSNIGSEVKTLFKENIIFVLIISFVLILLLPFYLKNNPYWIFMLCVSWVWIIIAQGINIQFGSAGIINLGGAFFIAMGAYGTAILTTKFGFNPLVGIFLGGIVSVLSGFLLIIPILKVRGHYLALVTLSAVIAFHHFANNVQWIGGSQGITNLPPIQMFHHSFVNSLKILNFEIPPISNYFFLLTFIGILIIFISGRLSNSWVGLTLNAISEAKGDIISSNCMGLNREKWIAISFSIGNFFIGISGALFAHMTSYVAPQDVNLYRSLLYLSAVIIGGMDNIWGVTIAAFLLVILPEKFKILQEYWILVFMAIILFMIIFRPQGLLSQKIRNYGYNKDKI